MLHFSKRQLSLEGEWFYYACVYLGGFVPQLTYLRAGECFPEMRTVLQQGWLNITTCFILHISAFIKGGTVCGCAIYCTLLMSFCATLYACNPWWLPRPFLILHQCFWVVTLPNVTLSVLAVGLLCSHLTEGQLEYFFSHVKYRLSSINKIMFGTSSECFSLEGRVYFLAKKYFGEGFRIYFCIWA